MSKLFKQIGHRIIAVVGIVVTLSLLAMGLFYVQQQETNILEQNERTMIKLTESVISSLQSVMLAGYADIAQSFAERLEKVNDIEDFRIMRINGTRAFQDNATINDVNARRGEEEFIPRNTEKVVPVLPADHQDMRTAIETQSVTRYYETDPSGERFLTYLAPILNDSGCHKCHGKAKPVRGVLKLTTSLAPVQKAIKSAWMQSFVVFGIAITVILLLTGIMIRRSIVNPIHQMIRAMVHASKGDLSQTVPVVGDDELGQMAGSFNDMTNKLQATYTGLQNEQDKLATIILSAREGIVVTDSDGTVVLMNPASEHLLGKNMKQVVKDGFLSLIDDPDGLQTLLDRDPDVKEAEVVNYNDLVLSIYASTIRAYDGHVLGSAALIRDITEEKRLEEQLRWLSTTDGLTGLFNRRSLDERLAHEFDRAWRYQLPLSIIMFDVDHFKRFNDDHGHDQGDRVLQAIAHSVQESLRKIDVPCRYGGEEFLTILPGTSLEGAMIVAERLRHQIEVMEVDGLKVTISIGVAAIPELDIHSYELMIEAADQALYTAKRAGRNQVITAQPSPATAK